MALKSYTRAPCSSLSSPFSWFSCGLTSLTTWHPLQWQWPEVSHLPSWKMYGTTNNASTSRLMISQTLKWLVLLLKGVSSSIKKSRCGDWAWIGSSSSLGGYSNRRKPGQKGSESRDSMITSAAPPVGHSLKIELKVWHAILYIISLIINNFTNIKWQPNSPKSLLESISNLRWWVRPALMRILREIPKCLSSIWRLEWEGRELRSKTTMRRSSKILSFKRDLVTPYQQLLMIILRYFE